MVGHSHWHYIHPGGKKRADGLYEPCCEILTGTKDKGLKKAYLDILKRGFPNAEEAKYYNIGDAEDPSDKNSAVFIPGTKIIEQRRFPGLQNLPLEHLKECARSAITESQKSAN